MGPGRRTNGFAIAAIIGGGLCIVPVLGLFTAVLAIAFGIIALRQIKKSEGAQKGLFGSPGAWVHQLMTH